MDVRLDFTRLLAGCLLAGAAACAAAQSGSDANGNNAAGSDAKAGDAAVPAPAKAKQAREIAQGDPARWHREDATGAQRMRTRQKEIGAALTEAKNACREEPAAERQSCLTTAQETWQKEMAALRSEAPTQPGS